MISSMLSFLLACSPDTSHEGVLVGNPGDVKVKTAATTGLTLRTGAAPVAQVLLEDCAGAQASAAEGITIDLLGSTSMLLPAGEWCRLELVLDGPLTWTGEGDAGGALMAALEVDTLGVINGLGFFTGDRSLIFQLGADGWLDAETLGLSQGSDVTLDASHPDYSDVLDGLQENLALYLDEDEDGAVGRAEPRVATTTGQGAEVLESDTGEEEDEDEASGCVASEGEAPVALLLLPLLVWRRQRSPS